MKYTGFKKVLEAKDMTAYQLSKLINYNMSSCYKLYQGNTDFNKLELWVVKRIADVLTNGDITALVCEVENNEINNIIKE